MITSRFVAKASRVIVALFVAALGVVGTVRPAMAFTHTRLLNSLVASPADVLHVAVDPISPRPGQVALGSFGKTFGTWRFAAGPSDPVIISRLDFINFNQGGDSNLRNLSLWINGVQVSKVISVLQGRARFYNLAITIPRGEAVVIALRADLPRANAGGVSGVTVRMGISIPAVITGVASDGIVATTNGAPVGSYMRTAGAANYIASGQSITQ